MIRSIRDGCLLVVLLWTSPVFLSPKVVMFNMHVCLVSPTGYEIAVVAAAAAEAAFDLSDLPPTHSGQIHPEESVFLPWPHGQSSTQRTQE